MESNTHSPSPDNTDSKAAFRKPLNDAANRKYRRKSPVNGSSSSDGSPKHERGSSPIDSGEAPARDTDARRKKDDGRDLERDSGRNHHGRGGDSYRHYDRQSNRSSHSYHRRDDYARHDRYTDEEDRHYKSSSRSGRESRVGSMSDYRRRENENYRSRDNLHGDEKYSRDGSGHRSSDKERDHEYGKYKDKDSSSDRAGSGRRHANLNAEGTKSGEWSRHKGDGDGRDEKRDYWRSSGDYKSDRSPVYEATGGHGDDVTSRRDSAGHRWKEASKSDLREVDGQKYAKEERKKYDNRETSRHKDRHDREAGEQFEDGTVFMSENKEESAAKKPKISLGGENVSKFTTVADERQSSKQANELGKVTSEQAPAKGSEAGNDIDAAKVAAMKAAELVNRNLVGTGYMSTDQKKKLLWGNKKNSTSEESGHRWDTALFSDRERQEKFNKLMSLRLPWYLWPIVGCEGGPKSGAQARESRKRPSGETEGTAAGFGEAIHRWTPPERRAHRWTWSLRVYLECFCGCTMLFSFMVVFSIAIILYFVIADFWILGVNYYAFTFLFEILDHDETRNFGLFIFGVCMRWKNCWLVGLEVCCPQT